MSDSVQKTAGLPDIPAIDAPGGWETVFEDAPREALEAALPNYLMARRWFGAKARTIREIHITETIPILPAAYVALLRVAYAQGEPETYVLPMAFAAGERAQMLSRERPGALIARLQTGQKRGILYDALWDPDFCRALLEAIGAGRQYARAGGDLLASPSSVLPRLRGDTSQPLTPTVMAGEQSNTSVRYDEQLILKLYRRLEAGINPDQEIGRFLTEKAGFAHTPPLAGAIEFRRREPAGSQPITVALLQGFVPNRGDAWQYTLDTLDDYFAAARSRPEVAPNDLPLPQAHLLELIGTELPTQAEQFIGAYLGSARLLGRRTAELHLALNSDPADPAFAPEPFTPDFQRAMHARMRELTDQTLGLLRAKLDTLPPAGQAEARSVLDLEGQIAQRFDTLLNQPIHALRSRIHGDYHLGQVLYTGDDFMIIDFEGEPARPLSERKMKRSPLQDVAGMLRSFHYAAYAAYFAQPQDSAPAPDLEIWARFWHRWVTVAFMQAYLRVVGSAPFLPRSPEGQPPPTGRRSPDELRLLLDAYVVEKAVYELGYELNNRPDWVQIPLQGILQTVQAGQ
jgi:maltose alpha-D-glucosyltransferase/alpha-amylase